jgi:hypothetical protein
MSDAATYRLTLEFRCDDHRLLGAVEQRIDGPSMWHSTVSDLVNAMNPAILERYPYISDSIDFLDLVELRVTAD